MMPYPPLGTLIAANVLRNAGMMVAHHDVMFSSREDEIEEAIERFRPKMVVIYDDSFNYLTKMCLSRMREAAFRLASYAKAAGCVTVVFSSDAVDHLEQYFAHSVDYVICGEAERTLTELATHVLGRATASHPESVPGLSFLKDGAVVRTPPRGLMKDLDVLPFPAWDLVDISRYRSAWKRRHGYFSINLSTTRGCPFHCNWCAKPLFGQAYTSRSPEHVVEEMKFLKETIRPDHLWITDDIFGLKRGWIERFSQIVNREDAVIPFKCLSRVDLLLKDNTIRHLADAGCRTVWVGAESGSQKILDAMEKGTTVEEIRAATRLLHSAGIRVGFFLQFGYPGEIREDIQLTLDLVRECMPDEIGVSVSYPLPGTKFYERVKKGLRSKQNWFSSQDLDLMFPGEYHPDFYRSLHKVLHKKFSVWRGMRMLTEFLRPSLRRTNGRSFRSLAGMFYHGATLPFALQKLESYQKTSSSP